MTVLRHRTPMPNSKDRPRKVGPRYTCQDVGQSSDIGTIDLNVGDRHQTSPEEGEIERRRSEQLYWAIKGGSQNYTVIVENSIYEKSLSHEGSMQVVYSAFRRDTSKQSLEALRRSESTGENIWRPPWGPIKQGPTRNRVKSFYQRYEECEARICCSHRCRAPWRGQRHHGTTHEDHARHPGGGGGI